MVHLRSSPDFTPDAVKLRLFRNAHHVGYLPAQLTVVPEAATVILINMDDDQEVGGKIFGDDEANIKVNKISL